MKKTRFALRPCVTVHISKLRFFNFSLKTLLPYLQRQAVPPYSSVIRKASFLKFSAGLNSEFVFMHFLLGYKRLCSDEQNAKPSDILEPGHLQCCALLFTGTV